MGESVGAELQAGAADLNSSPGFEWNDLKYFIAVARTGSTIAAGKALGISQSTVHRRIIALEKELRSKLVFRHPTGYRLTEEGSALLPYAEEVERAAADFARRVVESARELVGVVRITCPEPIVLRLVKSGLLEKFRARYPQLQVNFVTSDRYLDLAKGEADIAFRSGDTDDELVGRKIADSFWAVYGSAEYVARQGMLGDIANLADHKLVAFDEGVAGHRTLSWLDEVAPGAQFAARSNSVLGLVSAVRSGIGIGPLPTALGDADGLVRLSAPLPELTRSWRLLTHPDTRRSPRIAAFFEFIIEERKALQAILSG